MKQTESFDDPPVAPEETIPSAKKARRSGPPKCPVDGGQFGLDYRLHEHCKHCELAKACAAAHDKNARTLRDAKPRAMPLHLQIPVGLMIPELDAVDRAIIGLIHFREKGSNDGICFDKNLTFATVAGTSEATVSRKLGTGSHSLVTRGYVVAEVTRMKRRKRDGKVDSDVSEYRTSRRLRLTMHTRRLIARYRMDKDSR